MVVGDCKGGTACFEQSTVDACGNEYMKNNRTMTQWIITIHVY